MKTRMTLNGPEERWAQRMEWEEERRFEFDPDALSREDMEAIRSDEDYAYEKENPRSR